ncbi:MAG: acetyltransferase [Rhodothermales bacterium]
MKLFGVFGASGCGRGVMPLVRNAFGIQSSCQYVFVDDAKLPPLINGQKCMSFDAFTHLHEQQKSVCIAIADGRVRARVVARCEEAGLSFFSVRAGNVVVMDAVEIGEGTILSPFVTLTSNIRIGKHFHANLYSYVEHDCVIGDFVTFAPGAKCNGNIIVEDYAYIGAGAVIKQGKPGAPLRIGRGAVVGMGSVVTRDVADGVTVVGNPARPLLK